MALTTGRTQVCAGNSAGVVRLAAADRQNIASVTVSSTPGATYKAITAIVMETDEIFFEYDFAEETLNFVEDGTFENNTTLFDSVFTGSWTGWAQTDRTALLELYDSSPCGLVVIAELETGDAVLVGINPDRPTVDNKYTVKMRSSKYDSGKALQDKNGTDLTMGARSSRPATKFTPGWAGVPLS